MIYRIARDDKNVNLNESSRLDKTNLQDSFSKTEESVQPTALKNLRSEKTKLDKAKAQIEKKEENSEIPDWLISIQSKIDQAKSISSEKVGRQSKGGSLSGGDLGKAKGNQGHTRVERQDQPILLPGERDPVVEHLKERAWGPGGSDEGRRMTKYIVKEGESLWTIAEKELGNPYLWEKIYNDPLNRKRINDLAKEYGAQWDPERGCADFILPGHELVLWLPSAKEVGAVESTQSTVETETWNVQLEPPSFLIPKNEWRTKGISRNVTIRQIHKLNLLPDNFFSNDGTLANPHNQALQDHFGSDNTHSLAHNATTDDMAAPLGLKNILQDSTSALFPGTVDSAGAKKWLFAPGSRDPAGEAEAQAVAVHAVMANHYFLNEGLTREEAEDEAKLYVLERMQQFQRPADESPPTQIRGLHFNTIRALVEGFHNTARSDEIKKVIEEKSGGAIKVDVSPNIEGELIFRFPNKAANELDNKEVRGVRIGAND